MNPTDIRSIRETRGTLVKSKTSGSSPRVTKPPETTGVVLTRRNELSKVKGLPRMRRVSGRMVCAGFLRTQQRAKSQCIKHNLVDALRGALLECGGREVIF